jgi:phage terminase large subunit
MVGKAVAKKDTQVAYIATTVQQARDIAWAMLKKVAGKALVHVNETRLELTLRTVDGGTSTIWFRGWEAVDTLRGQWFDYLVIDEIASMRRWKSNWEEILRATLTDKQGEAMFISTPKGFNHFYDLFNKELDDPTYKSFQFKTVDNPHINPDEVEVAKTQMAEDAFYQEYEAEFRTYSGLVFKEFDRRVHVIDPIEVDEMTHYRYIDFGFTAPAAVGFIALDGEGNWYVYDEIYRKGLTVPELHQRIIEKSGDKYYVETYGDSAAAGDIQQLDDLDLHVTPVIKSAYGNRETFNAYKHRLIQEKLKVQEGTGKPKLFLFKNCKNHIKEFESYSYKEEEEDKYSESAEKKNDHLIDGLSYFAVSLIKPTSKKHKTKYGHQ